jgi:hypothetical protein
MVTVEEQIKRMLIAIRQLLHQAGEVARWARHVSLRAFKLGCDG